MEKKRSFLGEILLNSGMIFESQLLMALNEQRSTKLRFGEILIKNGWISETELVRALSEQLGIASVSLSKVTPETQALKLVPLSMAERLEILPIFFLVDTDTLVIATSEPLDILTIDELRFYTNKNIDMRVASLSDIRRNCDRFYQLIKGPSEYQTITVKNILIGGILLNAGLINENQISTVLEEQKQNGMRFGEILLSKGWISEKALAQGLSSQLKIPMISVAEVTPDPMVLRMVPRNVAEKLLMLPVSINNEGILVVAAAEPMDIVSIDEIKRVSGMEIEINISVPSELKKVISNIYDALEGKSPEIVNPFKDTLLGQIILNAGFVSDEQLDQVVHQQNTNNNEQKRLGTMLIEKGYLKEEELVSCLSRQTKVPVVNLSFYDPDIEALGKMPQRIAERYEVLPLTFREDGRLLLAVSEPLSAESIKKLELITGEKLDFRITIPSSLKEEISRFYEQRDLAKDQKIFTD